MQKFWAKKFIFFLVSLFTKKSACMAFYEVYIKDTGEDLLEYGLESLTFEKSTEKDNILTLNFRNVDDAFIDKDLIAQGTEIVFLYGINDGGPDDYRTSGKRLAKVSKVKRSYQGAINNITVIATDMGAYMKKVRSKKVWSGTTASIVREIADLYKVKATISGTTLTHKNLPQGNMTYYDFLKYLASIEKDGDLEFYVNDFEIYFGKRRVDDKSKITYSRQDKDGKVIALQIDDDEYSNFGKADNVKVSTINTKSAEVNSKSVDNKTIASNVKTQTYNANYDQNGKLVYKSAKDSNNSAGRTINSPSDDKTIAENFANSTIKKAQLESIKGRLEISLEPTLEVNTIITLEGFPIKDIGNYLVTSVRDTVDSGGGGRTSVEIKRAAVGKAKQTQKTEATVNKSTGGEKITAKKPSNVFYNQDANKKG